MSVHADRRADLVVWQVLLFAVVVLCLRMTGQFNFYFFEEDEAAIATGIAALVQHLDTDLYRYTPQLGYYRILEYITRLSGGNLLLIPVFMKGLSALAGTLLPLAALFAFRKSFTTSERWLAALVLFANPTVWKSSQYGNTAMLSVAVASLALVILSNRPRPHLEWMALLLFAIAIIIRADAVLLGPALALLVWQNHRYLGAVLLRGALLGFGLLAVYALLFQFDPQIDNAGSAMARHFGMSKRTFFWEYLIWAISPLVLVFVVLGFSQLLDTRRRELLVLALWAVVPLAFYLASTTTPRYFLLATMPLALAASTGIHDLAKRLGARMVSWLAWSIVAGLAFVHLLVGLGQFSSSWMASPLYAPTIRTHDGNMPTGALIYDTYLRHGVLGQSYNHPGFGKTDNPRWEGVAFNRAISELQAPHSIGHTTVFILDGGLGTAFHYHMLAAGAIYDSIAPANSSLPFQSEIHLSLGAARVMTIGRGSPYYGELAAFPVRAGDRFWVMGKRTFPDEMAMRKLPAGYELQQDTTFDNHIRVYTVTEGSQE